MATSSIFAQIKITDPEKAEAFVRALEESEKEQAKRKPTTSSITILRDLDEIRKLMAKRIKPDEVSKGSDVSNQTIQTEDQVKN